jgi:hypothetical protein
MAVLEKFNQKNKSLFAKIETVSDTYVAPAATDALPVITLSGSVTNETGSYEYLGDLLNRDEYSYLKDQYADFQAETPQQTLGTLNAGLTVANAPLSTWFQAVGGYVTVLGTALGSFPAGSVFIDNSRVSDSSLSVDYRLSSAQNATAQKLRKFTACRGMVDVGASIGDVPKLKFSMKGNASDPIQSPTLTPVFGNQFTNVAAPVRDTTIANAEIASSEGTFTAFVPTISTITRAANIATVTTATAHSLGANGSIRFVNISGASDALYNGLRMITIISTTTFIYTMEATPAANAVGTFTMTVGAAAKSFCFNTLTAANFFGFDIARYQTGCEVGFDKKAVPSDVSVSILELPAPKTVVTAIASTTTTATVTAIAHGLVVGDTVTIAVGMPQYDGTYTVLAGGLTADQFTYTIASYSGSFSGLGVVTNDSYSKFDPDSNISKFFGAQVKFGTGAAEYVTYKWDKLQVKDSKEGTVSNYLGRDVTFRNTGKSFIILS